MQEGTEVIGQEELVEGTDQRQDAVATTAAPASGVACSCLLQASALLFIVDQGLLFIRVCCKQGLMVQPINRAWHVGKATSLHAATVTHAGEDQGGSGVCPC